MKTTSTTAAVALGIIAVYGMIVVRMGVSPLERTHLFEYGLLSVLVHRALEARQFDSDRVLAPAVTAFVVTALVGWADEILQLLLPDRVYDWRDVGVNSLAGLMGVLARVVLRNARSRLRR